MVAYDTFESGSEVSEMERWKKGVSLNRNQLFLYLIITRGTSCNKCRFHSFDCQSVHSSLEKVIVNCIFLSDVEKKRKGDFKNVYTIMRRFFVDRFTFNSCRKLDTPVSIQSRYSALFLIYIYIYKGNRIDLEEPRGTRKTFFG